MKVRKTGILHHLIPSAHSNLTPLTRATRHLADSAAPVSNLMLQFPRKFTMFDKVSYTCCPNRKRTGKIEKSADERPRRRAIKTARDSKRD